MINIGDNAETTRFISEFDGGFDFGEHGTGFEIAFIDEFGEFFGGDFMNSSGVWLAEIDISIRNGGNGNENIGFDFFGEALGGVIFVYDGVDASETLQDFGAINWNATTSGSNNDDAFFD